MHDPGTADDTVIARSIDETALARAIRNNLYDSGDDGSSRSNLQNGHVIEQYIRPTVAESGKNGHGGVRERHENGSKRHTVHELPLTRYPSSGSREKNGNGHLPGNDADLLWLDEPQTLYLRKKLHIHDSVTFAGNLAHFLSSACVRDAMQKVRLVSDLRASADQAQFPLFAADCDGKIIAWNRAMEDLTGTPAQDVIGRKTSASATAVYGYARPMLIDSLIRTNARHRKGTGKRIAGGSDILTGREEMVWLQGGPRHIRCRARYIHDDQGSIIGAIQSVGILEPPTSVRSFSDLILAPAGPSASTVPSADEQQDISGLADFFPAGGKAAREAGIPPETNHIPPAADITLARKQADLDRALGNLNAAEDDLLHNIRMLSGSTPSEATAETGQNRQEGIADHVIRDAREGIIVFDNSLRCILWNPFMERLTGMSAAEVAGKHAFDMFPDFQHSDVDLLLRQALAGSLVESSDISFRITLTGKQAWIRLLLSPLHDSSGGISGIIAVVQDTTARRVMEYALESTIVQLMESEEKYRSVFNAKNDPLLLVDAGAQTLLDLNEAALELYGYSRAEFLSLSLGDLFTAPEQFGNLLVPHTRGIRMFRQRRKDGTLFPADVSYANFELKGRDLLLLSVRDTTSIHETSDALRLANTKLNLLIGVTRHDVLNNLTVAMGYNDLLQNTISDKNVLTMLEKEEVALQTIRRQIEFTREYYNLGVKSPVWQNVCETSTRAYSQFVTTIAYSCETRDLEIYADPLLEKVFYNLFDNAIRHGESVYNIVTYWIRDGSDLVLVFGDDGEGITEENKERIFRKGFGHHTGLGLFLTREILAITRIEITETGEHGKGARFELRIPAGRYRFLESASPVMASQPGNTDFLT